jgi:two-component system, chemotaxis family, chemotaxis protein CheY
MRCLIVDDDANSRRVIELLLRPHGTCICAANGSDALKAYLESLTGDQPFDVVYLDILMPDMSGLDFLESARQLEAEHKVKKAVPVVMLTGNAQVSNINRAQLLGVVEYLLKPISEQRLLQGLERLDLLET